MYMEINLISYLISKKHCNSLKNVKKDCGQNCWHLVRNFFCKAINWYFKPISSLLVCVWGFDAFSLCLVLRAFFSLVLWLLVKLVCRVIVVLLHKCQNATSERLSFGRWWVRCGRIYFKVNKCTWVLYKNSKENFVVQVGLIAESETCDVRNCPLFESDNLNRCEAMEFLVKIWESVEFVP